MPALAAALSELRGGRVVALYDARNERADLIAAAALTRAETVALMAREARGLVAVALTPERCRRLGLREMVSDAVPSTRDDRALPLVSIEARQGVKTGISAADRARTIVTAALDAEGPGDLVSPGHVFPVAAAPGGLLERYGRIEAAADAVRLAGLRPAAAICDVLNEDGDLAGLDEVIELSQRVGLARVAIGDLADARLELEWGAS